MKILAITILLLANTVFAQDTTPPTVAIIEPAEYSTVRTNSTVVIRVNAFDDVAVWFVHIYVDGVVMDGCGDTSAPYECVWRVPKKPRDHVIWAVAFDTSGNRTGAEAFLVTAVR